MQSTTSLTADFSQLDALENGCGLVRWVAATLGEHSGPDALDLLHRLTTKELLSVTEGHARRTALISDRGRVVDVFLVTHVAEEQLLLISDSADSERTVSAIDYYTIIEDAELADISGTHTRVSLIGPKAGQSIKSVLGVNVEADGVVTALFGSSAVTLASDTSRGVEWIDVVIESGAADQLVEAFEVAGAVATDSANFELFRISNEIPGADREYGEHANPIEAGLLHLIDWDKGCYVGQEVIARLDAYDKVQRNVKMLRSVTPLAEGAKLVGDDRPAGVVTSASALASEDGSYLSLALVRKAFLGSGMELDADGVVATVR